MFGLFDKANAIDLDNHPFLVPDNYIPSYPYPDAYEMKAGLSKPEAHKIAKHCLERIDYNKVNLVYTQAIQVAKKKRIVLKDAVCHAQFVNCDAMYHGSQFIETDTNKEISDTFWSWITGKTSPWYSITKDIEPVFHHESGKRTGWIIESDRVKSAEFNFIKNFAIATRMLNEKSSNISFWYEAQKHLNPSEAFYLCSFYKHNNKGISVDINWAGNMDGGHWPLGGNFNLDAFIKQSPVSSKYSINGCWAKKGCRYYQPSNDLGVSKQTRFSNVTVITMEDVLNHYEKWKRK